MIAARITKFRAPLEVGHAPDPACPPDGIVLKTLACGVCRSDWHSWVGHEDCFELPHIPGHEYCGVIETVGQDVSKWQKGDKVIAPFILACGICGQCQSGRQTACDTQEIPGFTLPGAFAEYVAVPRADANLARLPEGMDVGLAAALGCRATTAWQGLTARANLQPGEWVAIFGGGGIGLATQILAKAMGARVVVVDVVDEKLTYAKTLGADVVINASGKNPTAEIHDVTRGGAHVAVEALGIQETTVNAMKSLRKFGRMVQIGMPAGDHVEMTLPMDALYSGQLSILGTRGMPAHGYPSLFSMIESGQADLSPMIARRIPLSKASDELAAFDHPAPPGVAVITNFQN